MAVVSKSTILGYLGSTTEEVLNQISNILESHFHKTEGKIIKTLTEASGVITINFSDDTSKVLYSKEELDAIIAPILNNQVSGFIARRNKADLPATGDTDTAYFVLDDTTDENNNGTWGWDGSAYYQGKKLPVVNTSDLPDSESEELHIGKKIVEYVEAKEIISKDTFSVRNYLAISKGSELLTGEVETLKVIKNIVFEWNDESKVNDLWAIRAFTNGYDSPYEYYITLKHLATASNISYNFTEAEKTAKYAEFYNETLDVTIKIWFDYSLTTTTGLLISSSASTHNLIVQNGVFKVDNRIEALETNKVDANTSRISANESSIVSINSSLITLSTGKTEANTFSIRTYLNIGKETVATVGEVETLKVIKNIVFEWKDESKVNDLWTIRAFTNGYDSPFEYYITLKHLATASNISYNFTEAEKTAKYAEFYNETLDVTIKIWFDYSLTTTTGLLISSSASTHNLIVQNGVFKVNDRVTALEKPNHWRGEKVVLLGTSVLFGQYATKSYAQVAANILGFEMVNTGVPGLAIQASDDGNGGLAPKGSGSSCLTIAEYAANGITLAGDPAPYIAGGYYNSFYRSWENIFRTENQDAALYVFAVAPNNGSFTTTDWDDFNKETWSYNTGTFEDHRKTFLGALIYLFDKMYAFNTAARAVFVLDSEFKYAEGKEAFETFAAEFSIPIIDLKAKWNLNPKTKEHIYSEGGTNMHPSTFAHEFMGKALANELLLIS